MKKKSIAVGLILSVVIASSLMLTACSGKLDYKVVGIDHTPIKVVFGMETEEEWSHLTFYFKKEEKDDFEKDKYEVIYHPIGIEISFNTDVHPLEDLENDYKVYINDKLNTKIEFTKIKTDLEVTLYGFALEWGDLSKVNIQSSDEETFNRTHDIIKYEEKAQQVLKKSNY